MSGGIKVPKNNTAHSNGSGSMPKIVGPNVQGKREEYALVRRLQSALFGGVYEAKGLSSNRDFAIKVLHKRELTKAQETNSIEFCEVPLSEIRFADLMRGHPHVMEAEEHFEDAYCFYVVFELCRGGDLLEALKQKPHGFEEAHAQYLIKQAVEGMAMLHERHVAMQDVSLENMLLHVEESTGHYQVKICDPGQAVIFEVDENGEELPVNFRGLVGKSFRPPELHEQQPYIATKVDSWCLGWSTFYLLTAQPLFMSADPAQQDQDWLLFQQGDFASLFQRKCNLCSPIGLDFIFRLLQIDPKRRMTTTDALNHSWLAEPSIAPVLAPKEFWPESLRADPNRRPTPTVEDGYDPEQMHPAPVGTQNMPTDGQAEERLAPGQVSPGSKSRMQISSNELPTWASASNSGVYKAGGSLYGGVTYGQPRVSEIGNMAPSLSASRFGPDDRGRQRYPQPRAAHVISTSQSPRPERKTLRETVSPDTNGARDVGRRPPSPLSSFVQGIQRPERKTLRETYSPDASGRWPPSPYGSYVSGINRPNTAGSGSWKVQQAPYAPSRNSPQRTQPQSSGQGTSITFPRSLSPPEVRTLSPNRSNVRTLSPGLEGTNSASAHILSPGVSSARIDPGAGFSWPSSAPPMSPRTGTTTAPGVNRIASPSASLSRLPSPRGGVKQASMAQPYKPGVAELGRGFAWSPEQPSPRTSPRSYSPGPTLVPMSKAVNSSSGLPRWPPQM